MKRSIRSLESLRGYKMQKMEKTEYLFAEWTDLLSKGNRNRIKVFERIKIGEDFYNNFNGLTKIELFSGCFEPTSMKIAGEKVVGLLAENRQGEYFFNALFEDVTPGEVRETKVWLEGRYTVPHIIPKGQGTYIYRSNFAWVGPHLQRLSFPKGYEILSFQPEDGELSYSHGRPTITWRRAKEFWGEITVTFRDRNRGEGDNT